MTWERFSSWRKLTFSETKEVSYDIWMVLVRFELSEQKRYRACIRADRKAHFTNVALRAQRHADKGSLKGVYQAQRDIAPRPPKSVRCP